jgi:ankyrin repeat protein
VADVAEHLLRSGANPNAMNFWGDSPLHLATRSGDEKAIRLLLQVLEALLPPAV